AAIREFRELFLEASPALFHLCPLVLLDFAAGRWWCWSRRPALKRVPGASELILPLVHVVSFSELIFLGFSPSRPGRRLWHRKMCMHPLDAEK
ncbi:unnamed protein product, partial [Musa textilis]